MKDVVAHAPKGFGSDPAAYRCNVIFLKEPLTAVEAMKSITVLSSEPLQSNTERFYLPFFTSMDWRHEIRKSPDGLEVTFKVDVSGPTALVLAPILNNILEHELPLTVNKLIKVAENK